MFRAFLTFDNFIFPKLTVVVYWIGIVLILIAGIVGIISALVANNLLTVLGALIGTAVALPPHPSPPIPVGSSRAL